MYHTLIIVGNLGKDPEMRYTPSGQAVTNFSVASSRQYSKDGESLKETVWFRVSTWGKTAEACQQYLKKGSKVLVEGRLSPDKETGSPKVFETKNGHGSSYEVTATTVKFLSSAQNGDNSASSDDPF